MTAALKVFYLAHDLADAAVRRRVAMLKDGGASVTVAGFRRTAEPVDMIYPTHFKRWVTERPRGAAARGCGGTSPNSSLAKGIEGCAALDLGRTYNAGFLRRAWSVLRESMTLGRHRAVFSGADVILARNLEMLALGVRARRLCAPAPALVYECLDIHRLLLRPDALGSGLRRLEGRLCRDASALITSSPAFIRDYFQARSRVRLPIRLVENKVYPMPALSPLSRPSGPPWKIGWFGVIRCRESLKLLGELARASEGRVEIILRGRPALDQFDDFYAAAARTPGLRFLGPYANPGDLAAMYGEVHFTWAIDRFEAGMNSSWLLPNRLYEGGLYGSPPIAEARVETGRFIQRLSIGVALDELSVAALAGFFRDLTPEKYAAMAKAAAAVPENTWAFTLEDCRELAVFLQDLRHAE